MRGKVSSITRQSQRTYLYCLAFTIGVFVLYVTTGTTAPSLDEKPFESAPLPPPKVLKTKSPMAPATAQAPMAPATSQAPVAPATTQAPVAPATSQAPVAPATTQPALNDGTPPLYNGVTPSLRSEMNEAMGPYARFMTERSVRNITVFGEVYNAFTETEKAISGDDWIWTDDNAKVLEMLVLPGVYETAAQVTNKVLKFILKMVKSDFMLRRAAGPTTDATHEGFKVDNDECLNQRLHNGLMNFNGKPSAMGQSYRFHDGRDLDVVKHLAPEVDIRLSDSPSELLTFNLGNVSGHCIFRPVTGKGKIETGYNGTLSHKGVGIATFEYLIILNSKDTVTDHQVVLTPVSGGPKYTADIRMILGLIPNHESKIAFQRISAYRNGAIEELKIQPDEGVSSKPAFKGDAPVWYAGLTTGSAGLSYSSFRFISTPARFRNVITKTRVHNNIAELEEVSSRFECEPGVVCRVAERHLMTAGGLYGQMYRYIDIMAGVSRGEDIGMIDYSISYDIGAELNGLASFYLFATQNAYSTTSHLELNTTEIKGAIDHHLKIYWDIFCKKDPDGSIPNMFLRGLAFATMAVNTMYAATGDQSYLKQLEFAMDIMFSPPAVSILKDGVQQGEFAYRCFIDRGWTAIDCQASAHLLLGRLMATFPFGVSNSPSLQFCRIAEAAVKSGSPVYRPHEQEFGPNFTLTLAALSSFRWGFQGGLLTRGINAIRIGQERFPDACPYNSWTTPEQRAMWADLQASVSKYAEESTTYHEGGRLKEIRTSKLSGETNTESQPWIALGVHGRLVENLYRTSFYHAHRRHGLNLQNVPK